MHETIAETVSFRQLCERFGRIEIPIIQRDYAQGRVEQEGKFKPFLEVLLNALAGEPVVLDFVYGTIECGNTKGKAFLPLDGQQRLTTLFLLHAYLAIRLDLSSEERAFLTKFTYETRFSSRDFCKKLVDWKVPEELSASENWSNSIGDQPWYRPQWDKDPTIKAMQHALDQMAGKLSKKSEPDLHAYWMGLMNPEAPCVTFHLLPLDRLGLSDDLYIKMNARGVALTPFENFKASLEKRIHKEQWAISLSYGKPFSDLIDGLWLESFWSHFAGNFDNAMTAFIVHSSVCRQLMEQNDSVDEKGIIDHLIKPEIVTAGSFTQADFNTVCEGFDVIEKLKTHELLSFPSPLKMWHLRDKEQSPFKLICLNKALQYNQRVLFFAQLCFWKQSQAKPINSASVPENAYADWLRVVRNILMNAVVGDITSFRSALKRIQAMATGCLDIYGHLAQQSSTSGFAEAQFKEEVEKAQAISAGEQYRKVIHALEDTDFCKGNLTIPLYFARNKQKELDQGKLDSALAIIQREFASSFGYFAQKALLTIRDGQYFIHGKRTWSNAVNRAKFFPFITLEEVCDFWRTKRDNPIRDYFKEYFEGLESYTSQQLVERFLAQNMETEKKWRRLLIEGEYMRNFKCLALNVEENFIFVLRTQRDQNPIKVPADAIL